MRFSVLVSMIVVVSATLSLGCSTPAQRNNSNTAKPRAKPDALRGIYRGSQHQTHTGPVLSESGTDKRFITFYPDGRVFQGSAIEGTDAYDPDTDSVHGRYRLNGNVVEVTWSDGATISSPQAADGSVIFYGTQYTPLPTCDGLVLNGTYGRDWSNEYVEHRTIRFTPDGRFEDTGVLTQTTLLSSNKYLQSPPSWSSERPLTGSGIYRIRNNTLYLKYDNGARETVQIYLEPEHVGKEPVPEIVLGGWEFERK
jgi:hypothetical protein